MSFKMGKNLCFSLSIVTFATVVLMSGLSDTAWHSPAKIGYVNGWEDRRNENIVAVYSGHSMLHHSPSEEQNHIRVTDVRLSKQNAGPSMQLSLNSQFEAEFNARRLATAKELMERKRLQQMGNAQHDSLALQQVEDKKAFEEYLAALRREAIEASAETERLLVEEREKARLLHTTTSFNKQMEMVAKTRPVSARSEKREGQQEEDCEHEGRKGGKEQEEGERGGSEGEEGDGRRQIDGNQAVGTHPHTAIDNSLILAIYQKLSASYLPHDEIKRAILASTSTACQNTTTKVISQQNNMTVPPPFVRSATLEDMRSLAEEQSWGYVATAKEVEQAEKAKQQKEKQEQRDLRMAMQREQHKLLLEESARSQALFDRNQAILQGLDAELSPGQKKTEQKSEKNGVVDREGPQKSEKPAGKQPPPSTPPPKKASKINGIPVPATTSKLPATTNRKKTQKEVAAVVEEKKQDDNVVVAAAKEEEKKKENEEKEVSATRAEGAITLYEYNPNQERGMKGMEVQASMESLIDWGAQKEDEEQQARQEQAENELNASTTTTTAAKTVAEEAEAANTRAELLISAESSAEYLPNSDRAENPFVDI